MIPLALWQIHPDLDRVLLAWLDEAVDVLRCAGVPGAAVSDMQAIVRSAVELLSLVLEVGVQADAGRRTGPVTLMPLSMPALWPRLGVDVGKLVDVDLRAVGAVVVEDRGPIGHRRPFVGGDDGGCAVVGGAADGQWPRLFRRPASSWRRSGWRSSARWCVTYRRLSVILPPAATAERRQLSGIFAGIDGYLELLGLAAVADAGHDDRIVRVVREAAVDRVDDVCRAGADAACCGW